VRKTLARRGFKRKSFCATSDFVMPEFQGCSQRPAIGERMAGHIGGLPSLCFAIILERFQIVR
jgi:hypothetical protein